MVGDVFPRLVARTNAVQTCKPGDLGSSANRSPLTSGGLLFHHVSHQNCRRRPSQELGLVWRCQNRLVHEQLCHTATVSALAPTSSPYSSAQFSLNLRRGLVLLGPPTNNSVLDSESSECWPSTATSTLVKSNSKLSISVSAIGSGWLASPTRTPRNPYREHWRVT